MNIAELDKQIETLKDQRDGLVVAGIQTHNTELETEAKQAEAEQRRKEAEAMAQVARREREEKQRALASQKAGREKLEAQCLALPYLPMCPTCGTPLNYGDIPPTVFGENTPFQTIMAQCENGCEISLSWDQVGYQERCEMLASEHQK